MAGSDAVEFYGMAAQIIPVLFVALAFELGKRSFLPDDDIEKLARGAEPRADQIRRVAAAYTLVVTLALVLGEAAALIGMSHGHSVSFQFADTGWWVASAITIGGVGLAAPLFVRQLITLIPACSTARKVAIATLGGAVPSAV